MSENNMELERKQNYDVHKLLMDTLNSYASENEIDWQVYIVYVNGLTQTYHDGARRLQEREQKAREKCTHERKTLKAIWGEADDEASLYEIHEWKCDDCGEVFETREKKNECKHPHVHIVGEYGDANGNWDIMVECDDCGETWEVDGRP